MELLRLKNTDTRIVFPITKADGTLVTGAAGLDSEFASFNTADHGGAAPAWADCTHEAVEIGATGWYYLDVAAAEINADFTSIQVKSSTTGALIQGILIRTVGFQTGDAFARLGAPDGASVSADIAEVLAAVPAVSAIVNGILDAALSAHEAAGTVGLALSSLICKWDESDDGTTVTLYGADGTTVVGTFAWDNATKLRDRLA